MRPAPWRGWLIGVMVAHVQGPGRNPASFFLTGWAREGSKPCYRDGPDYGGSDQWSARMAVGTPLWTGTEVAGIACHELPRIVPAVPSCQDHRIIRCSPSRKEEIVRLCDRYVIHHGHRVV